MPTTLPSVFRLRAMIIEAVSTIARRTPRPRSEAPGGQPLLWCAFMRPLPRVAAAEQKPRPFLSPSRIVSKPLHAEGSGLTRSGPLFDRLLAPLQEHVNATDR